MTRNLPLDPFHAWMNEQVDRASDPRPPFTLDMDWAQAAALISAAYGAAGFHEAALIAPLVAALAEEVGVDEVPLVDGAWEYRVTWQRQGMARPRSRLYQTERGARRLVAKLNGEVLDWPDYSDKGPDDYWCCDQSYGCNCGGLTVAERVARDHADVPPMVFGPVIEVRPVGDWSRIATASPDPREPWAVDESGQLVNPVRTPAVATAAPATPTEASDEIPF